jgi:Concanavalin A-like lectin/glucanases superfamily
MWVQLTANSNGGYILSMDRWHGYKFNLNGSNVPFFTVSVSSSTIYDRDAGSASITSAWTHLTISFTSGTEKFYVNGALVKTWTDVPGGAFTLGSPVDLAIGNEMPKEFYNVTDSNDPNYFYGASYWVGGLDDIRFYNIVLTDAEILSIYKDESTL